MALVLACRFDKSKQAPVFKTDLHHGGISHHRMKLPAKSSAEGGVSLLV
jgi:hypothetical protein